MTATYPKVLIVAGTRPELLKLAPVHRAFGSDDSALRSLLCFSGQHIELVDSVLGPLGIHAEIDLRAQGVARSLSMSLAWLIERLDGVVAEVQPDAVIVQGDTNTALAAAMVGFHNRIPIFHVEAGLRTADLYSPFPEEMNRRLLGRIATQHFAPTEGSQHNLLREGVDPATIFVTGNTAIDALKLYSDQPSPEYESIEAKIPKEARVVSVTLHRRENMEDAKQVTQAVTELVNRFPDIHIVWVLHLNRVRETVLANLSNMERVHLVEPLPYEAFVKLMKRSYVILSDSGGVQEEAPHFGTPVMVLRENTERPEAVTAGCAKLVGADREKILSETGLILSDKLEYENMARVANPFGDGTAAQKIHDHIVSYFADS